MASPTTTGFLLGALALASLTVACLARADTQAAPQSPGFTGGLLVQLEVADLDRSIEFYGDVLGFEIPERRDDLQFAHVATGLEGLQLGLSAGGETKPNPGTVVLNFDIRGDIEAFRKTLEAKGVVFQGPTHVIPGKVRLATFKDPDGYTVRLAGEDLPQAAPTPASR